MKILAIILFSVTMACAQPDTPQPQSAPGVVKCGPRWMGGCWDLNHPNLSVAQTFRSPHWLVPVALGDAAYWADALESRAAIRRGCVEGNADLPLRPSIGDYAENWAKFELPLDALEWAIVKLNRRPTNWIVNGMAATRVTIHMRGVHSAVTCLN